MDNIALVSNNIKEGMYQANPHGCAEAKAILAAEYSFYMGLLEDILSRKPGVWNLKRPEFKSDQACERWWEGTEDGINEVVIRLKIKRMEKLMSALSTFIRLAEMEAKNI